MSTAEHIIATVTGPNKVELLERSLPDHLEDDEVRGRTLVTLISPGTELNVYNGNYNTAAVGWGTFPCPPGYAAAFEVTAVGKDVEDMQPGDLAFCMGKHETYQSKPRKEVIPIPAGLDVEKAPYARMMNITMTTLMTTQARPGERVLVTGLGLVGHLCAQMFASCGYEVWGVDPREDRRNLAERKGIKHLLAEIPVGQRGVAGTFPLAVECAGLEQAVADAIPCVAKYGEVVLVGVPLVPKDDVHAHDILRPVFRNFASLRSGSEWWVPRQPDKSWHGSSFGDMKVALDWLAEGRMDVDGLNEWRKPADIPQAYDDMIHNRVETLTIGLDWRD